MRMGNLGIAPHADTHVDDLNKYIYLLDIDFVGIGEILAEKRRFAYRALSLLMCEIKLSVLTA